MSKPVYISVARSFARQKGVSENKVQPLAEIIERWHREFPHYAVMGKLSPEALALGPAIRKPQRRRERLRILKEENTVRAKIKRYITSQIRELSYSDRMAIGVGVDPIPWITLACWAWRNQELIADLISRIRELLAHDPFSRGRVFSWSP